MGSLNPARGMFEHAFNIQGIIPNNEAMKYNPLLEKYSARHGVNYGIWYGGQYCRGALYVIKYIF
ncbi:hypothetical protein KCP71_14845 [Salmonella enterica subsp. enterica]|nr:hypothetical protein KCP71_14845 [Salmonella enterica subsp. enterica]